MIVLAVLVCLVLAVVELYFWLVGHWFARVLAFPALTMFFLAILVVGFLPSYRAEVSPEALAIKWGLAVACIPAGWLASGIPMWHRQQQDRRKIADYCNNLARANAAVKAHALSLRQQGKTI